MLKNKKDNPGDDTPFNMAMLFYIRLNKLLDEKDQAAMLNDVGTWYNSLRAIYRNIFFKIDKKEKEKLDSMFQSASDILSSHVNNSAISGQIQAMVVSGAGNILDEIDREIMVIMDKRKMIFPRIDGAIGMEKIRERYGI